MIRYIIVSARAQRDLLRLADFLAARDPATARRAASRIEAAIRSLDEFSERGAPRSGGLRDLIIPFGRSGYVVRYDVLPDRVIITRIWHGRENRPL